MSGTKQESREWVYSTIFSVFFLILSIFVILIDYYTAKEYLFSDVHIVHEQEAVDRFLHIQEEKIVQHGGIIPARVPTGFLAHRIEFNNNGEIHIIGYAWQLFDKQSERYSNQELFLPEAFEQKITEIYRFNTETHLVVGWHVTARFVADYYYTKYPFDKHALLFTFSYKKMDQNVIFVPDFASYDLSKKDAKNHRGIISEGELIHWNIYKSDFCYFVPQVSNQYGSPESIFLQPELPQFSLIVAVERDYIFPLLYSIIPLLVIFFVLFSVTLVLGLEQVGVYHLVTLVSSIFFAILIAQQLYDSSLPVLAREQATFIDYLYFISYIYAFLIAVNGLLYYGRPKPHAFIAYKENLLVRLLYWPLLTFLVFLGTLSMFC